MDEKRRCDYLYVRHTKVGASSPDVPSKLYKVGVPGMFMHSTHEAQL